MERRERDMTDEELRQTINEVREMKQMCGNINMKLTNIVTQRGQNWKEKLEAEYQRGLEDAWNVARKIAVETYDGGVSISALYEMFGTESMCMIMKNNTVYDAADKLKSYEEKQKAEDEIKVGDEVNWIGDCFIVTRIFQPRTQKEQCDGIDDDGCVYHDVLMNDLEKTGRHFDIHKILKEMKE